MAAMRASATIERPAPAKADREIEFVLVDAVPSPGHIAHSTDSWSVPAGGGGVMAVQMARVAIEARADDQLLHFLFDNAPRLFDKHGIGFRQHALRQIDAVFNADAHMPAS